MDSLRDPRQRPGSSLIGRLRRWLRPPRSLRPTRAGWLFFVIIFGVGFAALNTGNNLLYLVLSLMLAFLALSGILSETALRGIRVRRRIPRELYALGENPIQVEITNDQRHVPAFAIVVEDRLRPAADGQAQVAEEEEARAPLRRRRRKKRRRPEAAGRCFALRIGAAETEARRYALAPCRRGPITFAGFVVSTRFPFGLFLKSRSIDSAEEALVYPELVGSGVAEHVPQTHTAGQTTISASGQGGSVIGVREYREGDSPRHVHWPTSLRRRALLVCETEDDRDAEIEVRLEPAKGADAEATNTGFERGVSRAAAEVARHLGEGHAVALRTDSTFLPADAGARQKTRLLSFLARVGRDGQIPGATPHKARGLR